MSTPAATIDSGFAPFTLSGFLGGFASQTDNAVLSATFNDGLGSLLGSASIGPVTNSDRGNATGLLLRSASGAVPTGTRTIDILLTFTRNQGTDNDGYADNLSLVISNKVTICHKGETITVSANAVQKHIDKHGDTMGPCP